MTMYPIKITIERTGNFEGFPLIPGDLPFSKITSGEFDNRDPSDAKPEAYVIDNEDDWNLILERINLDSDKSSQIPPIDFNHNTVLAYFFGMTRTGGNKYKIKKIEGIPDTLTIFVTIELVPGPLDVITSPYLIISIPKTAYKKVIFEIIKCNKGTLNIKNSNVTVIVNDIDKAISFYTNTLGLELVQHIKNQYAVIKTEGLTIGLNPIQHGLEPGNCKSLSIGFLIEGLNKTISELKNKGIVFSDIIIEPPLRIAYFTDQDNNPLYICEYLTETNSENK